MLGVRAAVHTTPLDTKMQLAECQTSPMQTRRFEPGSSARAAASSEGRRMWAFVSTSAGGLDHSGSSERLEFTPAKQMPKERMNGSVITGMNSL